MIAFIISLLLYVFSSGSEVIKSMTSHKEKSHPHYILNVDSLKIDAGDKTRKMDLYFRSLCTSAKFNGNVLIAENGKIIYANSYGFANFKTRDSLSLQSTFQLASASKPITATAILMLKDRALLQLDDPISKYIENFPYENVTIRMLLSHKSGLPNYMHFYENIDQSKYLSNQDVIDYLLKYNPQMQNAPGKRFRYNNTNFAILSYLVGKISGTSFERFVEDSIFEPLGMKNSYVFNFETDQAVQIPVRGYRYSHVEADFSYLDGVVGDKGIYSNVEDLFRFDQALYDEFLLKQESIEESIQFEGRDASNPYQNYGLGWRLTQLSTGKKIVFHTGQWNGFSSLILRVPEDRHTIIFLGNRKNNCFMNFYSILAILDEDLANQMMQLSIQQNSPDSSLVQP